jgi:UDP-glucose 4-epimerase
MTADVVTGASGFVGRSLLRMLPSPARTLAFGAARWREQLARERFEDAIVIHLAARAHRGGSDEDYRRDNVDKSAALAQAAAGGGARRFVYMSSIKVNGEESGTRPFRPDDAPHPEDAYGRSKAEAEAAVRAIADRHRMECVVVRSPLVYGAPAKGHLATLLRVADSALPLPFGAIANRRSFIACEDLCRALVACAQSPRAAGRTYLVAHRETVSTPRLLESARRHLGRPARLFDVPPRSLELAASLCGKSALMRRLTRSLEADASLAEEELGWTARVPFDEAMDGMVRAWREGRG